MTNKSAEWTNDSKNTVTYIKRLLGRLAGNVRRKQFLFLQQVYGFDKGDEVVDVGVASSEEIQNTNFFENNYPYINKITAVTIEDKRLLQKRYPMIKVIKVRPGKILPFKDRKFDLCVSWATLEHVGGYKEQEKFINELLRVGKKVFITTPYRGALYEPHSGLFFLHWLPLRWFRNVCKFIGRPFWSKESNLNPLYIHNIRQMSLIRDVDIVLFKTYNVLPSHLLIISK